jgi:hypothetical protein
MLCKLVAWVKSAPGAKTEPKSISAGPLLLAAKRSTHAQYERNYGMLGPTMECCFRSVDMTPRGWINYHRA